MKRIPHHLAAAIDTMRNACHDAERYAKDGDERAIQRVLHSLSWGFANASSSITAAMEDARTAHEIEAYEARLREAQVKAAGGEHG